MMVVNIGAGAAVGVGVGVGVGVAVGDELADGTGGTVAAVSAHPIRTTAIAPSVIAPEIREVFTKVGSAFEN